MKESRFKNYRYFNFAASLISYFLFPKFINFQRYMINKINTLCISREFQSIGKDPFIEFPSKVLGSKYIKIGNSFLSLGHLKLEAYYEHLGFNYNPSIEIGDDVSVNDNCHITSINKITIGNNVLIASKVFITDHFHGEISKVALEIPPSKRRIISKGPVIIEDNVWIGEGVAILPNVHIGKNAIIGANAVVTSDIPADSVAGGIPAKVIKYLT
jgi:acetyltransferase-like isoleucine patch superfamily enzyme